MIPSILPTRESRNRAVKMNRKYEKLCKSFKCRECTVVVTRMNFAKILGKFNKVKIQYENSSMPKGKKKSQAVSPVNSRLKSNQNGMVLLHRNAYNEHPVKEPTRKPSPRVSAMKENRKSKEATAKASTNVLKENNRLRKTPTSKPKQPTFKAIKYYGIMFAKPNTTKRNSYRNRFQLSDLLPIDRNLLPSDDWSIDYLPKTGEIKDDKVYDRIAAELEDLMNSEKCSVRAGEKDDFPSIIDILNEGPKNDTNNQCNTIELKSNLDSSDVEAMLLGEPSVKGPVVAMELDGAGGSEPSGASAGAGESPATFEGLDNPNSPSILDEALVKGAEEHIPALSLPDKSPSKLTANNIDDITSVKYTKDAKNKENNNSLNLGSVTHVVFKKLLNGKCCKSVTCPRNLKYSVELEGKSVEFLGAPKFISSAEDLRVLLEIVNESQLDSLYVSH